MKSLNEMFPRNVRGAVLVAALGYFVDVYDLLIFSIVRVASLRSIGVPDHDLLSTGVYLLNMQMFGMLVGGVAWGVWGDKRGRLSVLLGSIFVYSTANIANGFVTTVSSYGIWRFIAGVGLAGELGAGITLVSELMPKESRGFGTTFVASIGIAGAIFAALIGDHFSWQTTYFIGGGLGLSLLTLRVAVRESGMFDDLKGKKEVQRGRLSDLFKSRERFTRYLNCIIIGLPVWYVIGILVTFSPEFGREFGITDTIKAGRSVMFAYIGLVFGDLTSGLLSQFLKSRKKVLLGFIVFTAVFILIFLYIPPRDVPTLYTLCLPLGFGVGYWAVFVSNAAEQFGTNLRSTVTTSVPNFVRGAVVPLTFSFEFLKPKMGIVDSALIVGVVSIFLAVLALSQLKETFGRNLDYLEK